MKEDAQLTFTPQISKNSEEIHKKKIKYIITQIEKQR